LLQCVAVCCSVLQCVATSVDWCDKECSVKRGVYVVVVGCGVLQCAAVCCIVLQPQGMGVVTSVLSKEVCVCCCSMLQCNAICCDLQG